MKRFFISGSLIVASIVYAIYQYAGNTLTYVADNLPTRTIPPPVSQPESSSVIIVSRKDVSAPAKTQTRVQTQTQTQAQTGSGMGMGMNGGMMKSCGVSGTYTGAAVDAYYGTVQVQATVSCGKLTDVRFLQYPSDRSTSQQINDYAMPILRQEAIAAQSAQVDAVSGATHTSGAFVQSLASALAKAGLN